MAFKFCCANLAEKELSFQLSQTREKLMRFFFKQAFFSEFKIFDISYCNAAVGHSKGFLPPGPMTHKVMYLFAVPNTSLRSSVLIRKMSNTQACIGSTASMFVWGAGDKWSFSVQNPNPIRTQIMGYYN